MCMFMLGVSLHRATVQVQRDVDDDCQSTISCLSRAESMMQQLEDGAVCIICHGPLGYKPEERKQARKDLHAKPMCLCIKGNAYKNNVLLTHCLECACKQAGKRTPHNPGCESVLFMPGNLSSMNSIRLL